MTNVGVCFIGLITIFLSMISMVKAQINVARKSKLIFDDTFLNGIASQSRDILDHANATFDSGMFESIFLEFKNTSTSLSKIMDSTTVVPKIGFGFIAGFSSGFFIKKVTKMVLFTIGGAIVSIQTLCHFGYIDLKLDKIKHDLNKVLDWNVDGKADRDDLLFMYHRVSSVYIYCIIIR